MKVVYLAPENSNEVSCSNRNNCNNQNLSDPDDCAHRKVVPEFDLTHVIELKTSETNFVLKKNKKK